MAFFLLLSLIGANEMNPLDLIKADMVEYRSNLRNAEGFAAIIEKIFSPKKEANGKAVPVNMPNLQQRLDSEDGMVRLNAGIYREVMVKKWENAQQQIDEVERLTKKIADQVAKLKKEDLVVTGTLEELEENIERADRLQILLTGDFKFGVPHEFHKIGREYPMPLTDLIPALDKFNRLLTQERFDILKKRESIVQTVSGIADGAACGK